MRHHLGIPDWVWQVIKGDKRLNKISADDLMTSSEPVQTYGAIGPCFTPFNDAEDRGKKYECPFFPH